MYKKIIYIFSIIYFLTSCGSLNSVKRGLTGEKAKSVDEFFIKKKDPLILPPDYENLPSPDEKIAATEELSIFKETLSSSIEDSELSPNSTESSILKKIQSK
tara:strand:+ start:502 stop:807 length:306 start_codon:yes stop_codon:yes gene_type:complete